MLENYTEELLGIHEHQVEVMKNYYEENKNIFKLVEKREALFKTMEEFEVMLTLSAFILLVVTYEYNI